MIIAALWIVPVGLASAGRTLVAPHILPMGFAVAMLSSAVPYTLEMTALRRLVRKDVRNAYEPGTGRRGTCRSRAVGRAAYDAAVARDCGRHGRVNRNARERAGGGGGTVGDYPMALGAGLSAPGSWLAAFGAGRQALGDGAVHTSQAERGPEGTAARRRYGPSLPPR